MSAKSSNYKIVINPSGDDCENNLDGNLHSYPAFDGFFVNIKTANHKTACQNICSQNSNLQFWRYYNILEYPFSQAVGGTADEYLQWIRRNIQFTGANPGTTNKRMLVSGTPQTVALSQLYFTGPSAPVSCSGATYLGSSADWEFQELWHWYDMDSTTADSIVAKMVDLADDIQAAAGVFLDQCWLRGWGWFWGVPSYYGTCSPTPTFQSGHHDNEDEDGGESPTVLQGASDADIASTYGESSTWATWRSNIQYFFDAIDTEFPNLALKNGDWRQNLALNGGESVPTPYYLEGSNIALMSGKSLEDYIEVWDDNDYNVLGFRVKDYAGLQDDLDTVIAAWRDRGGGYVALEESSDTNCGFGESTFLNVWNQLVGVGQSEGGSLSGVRHNMGSRTGRRGTRNLRLGWDRKTLTHTGGTSMETKVFNSDGTLYTDALEVSQYENVTVTMKLTATGAPTSVVASTQHSVDGGTTWITIKMFDTKTNFGKTFSATDTWAETSGVSAPLMRLKLVSSGCDGDNYFTTNICRVLGNPDGESLRHGAQITTLTGEGQTVNGESYNCQGMDTSKYRRIGIFSSFSAVTFGTVSMDLSADGGTTWHTIMVVDGIATSTLRLHTGADTEASVHIPIVGNLSRVVYTSNSGDLTMSHARVALRE